MHISPTERIGIGIAARCNKLLVGRSAEVRNDNVVSDGRRRQRARPARADCSVYVNLRIRTSCSAEDAADTVLNNASENLATNTSHAHAPARRREVVRPFLLGIAVAAESGTVNQLIAGRAWVLGYARVCEADGVRDIEDKREGDDWYESGRRERVGPGQMTGVKEEG